MQNKPISKQDNSADGIIELHSTCPISKIQIVGTNFYSRMMTEPPFHWKTGQKPSIAEAERVTALVHNALEKLEKKQPKKKSKQRILSYQVVLKVPWDQMRKRQRLRISILLKA